MNEETKVMENEVMDLDTIEEDVCEVAESESEFLKKAVICGCIVGAGYGAYKLYGKLKKKFKKDEDIKQVEAEVVGVAEK